MTMNVALFSAKDLDRTSFEKYRPKDITVEYIKDAATPEVLDRVLTCGSFQAICVFVNDEVNKACIDVCKKHNIKAIFNRCAGFDKVDVAYAESCGITVARVPAYSPYAVAEHAVSLLCTLNRKTHLAFNRVSCGNFSIDGLVGMDLYGKTVGVVGTGKIGQIVIDIMTGFGCKIAAYDVYVNQEYAKKPNVTYMELDSLYRESDVITLHTPLLPTTQHMINKDSISKMKDGVIIINAARGGLVDTNALMDGIASGKIRGAGLDVYEREAGLFFNDMSNDPSIYKDKDLCALMASSRVVLSAHQAFLTDEALEAIAKTTFLNASEIAAGKKGKELTNAVTKENLTTG